MNAAKLKTQLVHAVEAREVGKIRHRLRMFIASKPSDDSLEFLVHALIGALTSGVDKKLARIDREIEEYDDRRQNADLGPIPEDLDPLEKQARLQLRLDRMHETLLQGTEHQDRRARLKNVRLADVFQFADKFFRLLLDLHRVSPFLNKNYQHIVTKAFDFTLKHDRIHEFNRLVRDLRRHLGWVQPSSKNVIIRMYQENPAFPLTDEDTIKLNFETRLEAQRRLIEKKWWGEAFTLAVDNYTLIQEAKANKIALDLKYIGLQAYHLSKIFLNYVPVPTECDYLAHAFSLVKLATFAANLHASPNHDAFEDFLQYVWPDFYESLPDEDEEEMEEMIDHHISALYSQAILAAFTTPIWFDDKADNVDGVARLVFARRETFNRKRLFQSINPKLFSVTPVIEEIFKLETQPNNLQLWSAAQFIRNFLKANPSESLDVYQKLLVESVITRVLSKLHLYFSVVSLEFVQNLFVAEDETIPFATIEPLIQKFISGKSLDAYLDTVGSQLYFGSQYYKPLPNTFGEVIGTVYGKKIANAFQNNRQYRVAPSKFAQGLYYAMHPDYLAPPSAKNRLPPIKISDDIFDSCFRLLEKERESVKTIWTDNTKYQEDLEASRIESQQAAVAAAKKADMDSRQRLLEQQQKLVEEQAEAEIEKQRQKTKQDIIEKLYSALKTQKMEDQDIKSFMNSIADFDLDDLIETLNRENVKAEAMSQFTRFQAMKKFRRTNNYKERARREIESDRIKKKLNTRNQNASRNYQDRIDMIQETLKARHAAALVVKKRLSTLSSFKTEYENHVDSYRQQLWVQQRPLAIRDRFNKLVTVVLERLKEKRYFDDAVEKREKNEARSRERAAKSQIGTSAAQLVWSRKAQNVNKNMFRDPSDFAWGRAGPAAQPENKFRQNIKPPPTESLGWGRAGPAAQPENKFKSSPKVKSEPPPPEKLGWGRDGPAAQPENKFKRGGSHSPSSKFGSSKPTTPKGTPTRGSSISRPAATASPTGRNSGSGPGSKTTTPPTGKLGWGRAGPAAQPENKFQRGGSKTPANATSSGHKKNSTTPTKRGSGNTKTSTPSSKNTPTRGGAWGRGKKTTSK